MEIPTREAVAAAVAQMNAAELVQEMDEGTCRALQKALGRRLGDVPAARGWFGFCGGGAKMEGSSSKMEAMQERMDALLASHAQVKQSLQEAEEKVREMEAEKRKLENELKVKEREDEPPVESSPSPKAKAKAKGKSKTKPKDASVRASECARVRSTGPQAAEYTVTLDQTSGKRMGVDLLPGGKRLIIGDINDASGLIEEWNRTAPKEKRVKNFHLITEVNGVGGDAQEMLRECQSDQVLELQLIKVEGDPWSHKDFVLAKVSEDGIWLEHASAALRNDRDVVLAAVLSVDPFDAVAKASVELLQEADFVLELVKETKAPWLLKLPELKHFAQNKSFRAQCDEVAGTGLVFTWYQSSTCFWDMRKHFSAITGSVPGGKASEAVVEELSAIEGGLSTVCFGDRPVFGAYADDGRWEHPLGAPCGRDEAPVPEERTGMWSAPLAGRRGEVVPEVGSRHPCWCCRWLAEVREKHVQGATICCAISNIYASEWVSHYGAGSSELSDAEAERLKLPREVFKNGRPRSWGEGIFQICGENYHRAAPLDPRSGKPLGHNCRWERKALDQLGFPVFAFFMP